MDNLRAEDVDTVSRCELLSKAAVAEDDNKIGWKGVAVEGGISVNHPAWIKEKGQLDTHLSWCSNDSRAVLEAFMATKLELKDEVKDQSKRKQGERMKMCVK